AAPARARRTARAARGPRATRPGGARRRASPDLLHHLHDLLHVALGVDGLGDQRAAVAEGELGGLEAELAADVGAGGVAEPVRVPAVFALPAEQLRPALGAEARLPLRRRLPARLLGPVGALDPPAPQ